VTWPWIIGPEPLDVLTVGGGNVALVAGGRQHFLFCDVFHLVQVAVDAAELLAGLAGLPQMMST